MWTWILTLWNLKLGWYCICSNNNVFKSKHVIFPFNLFSSDFFIPVMHLSQIFVFHFNILWYQWFSTGLENVWCVIAVVSAYTVRPYLHKNLVIWKFIQLFVISFDPPLLYLFMIWQDESLKHEADQVLSEVTRKKSEAQRQINMLAALQKLRRVRTQMATHRGERIDAESGLRFVRVTG